MAIKPTAPPAPPTPKAPTVAELADTWEHCIDRWVEAQPPTDKPLEVPLAELPEAVRVELAERYARAGWHPSWTSPSRLVLARLDAAPPTPTTHGAAS